MTDNYPIPDPNNPGGSIPRHPVDPQSASLETDPEVSAKRTAEMQQLAAEQGILPPKPTRNLTIVWEEEKNEILRRLEEAESRLTILEAWAKQLKREPTFFTKE